MYVRVQQTLHVLNVSDKFEGESPRSVCLLWVSAWPCMKKANFSIQSFLCSLIGLCATLAESGLAGLVNFNLVCTHVHVRT